MAKRMGSRIQTEIDNSKLHYNVVGFNQITVMACKKIVKNRKNEDTLLQLKIEDLVLLKGFDSLANSENAERYRHINPEDGLEYQQVSYKLFAEKFPILGFNANTIRRCFYKYRDLGILQHYHRTVEGSFSCYRWSNGSRWILIQPEIKEELENPEKLNQKLELLEQKLGTSFQDIKTFQEETQLRECLEKEEKNSSVINVPGGGLLQICQGGSHNNGDGVGTIMPNIESVEGKSVEESKDYRENRGFSTTDLNNESPGIEKEQKKEKRKFDLNIKTGLSGYIEKLEKEYGGIISLFKTYNIHVPAFKQENTAKEFYDNLKAVEAGELKSKVSPEFLKNNKELADYTKLDKPRSGEHLCRLFEKSIKNFVEKRDNLEMKPLTKTHLEKVTAPTFLVNTSKNKETGKLEKRSYLLTSLAQPPEPLTGKGSYQLTAVIKKLESLKIDKTYLMKKLYNNSDGAHAFTESQWQQVFFSVHSIIKYIEQNEELLILTGGYYPPKQALELVGEWQAEQTQVFSDFAEGKSGPWQWFNKWMRETRGVNFLIDEKQVPALRERQGQKVVDQARKFFNETLNANYDKMGLTTDPESEAVKDARARAMAKFPDVELKNFMIVKG